MWTTPGQEPNSSREMMDARYRGFNFKVKLLFCCIISIDIALGHIFPYHYHSLQCIGGMGGYGPHHPFIAILCFHAAVVIRASRVWIE